MMVRLPGNWFKPRPATKTENVILRIVFATALVVVPFWAIDMIAEAWRSHAWSNIDIVASLGYFSFTAIATYELRERNLMGWYGIVALMLAGVALGMMQL